MYLMRMALTLFSLLGVSLLFGCSQPPSSTPNDTVVSSDSDTPMPPIENPYPGAVPGGVSDSGIPILPDSITPPPLDATSEFTWQSYSNQEWGFRIDYPTILSPTLADAAGLAAPQRAEITFARSQGSADLMLPTMVIRVFDNPDQLAPADWATTYRPDEPPGAEYAPFNLANASGVQACSMQMIAPRCAFYLASQGHIYQLVPYDDIGTQMQNRLSFTQ